MNTLYGIYAQICFAQLLNLRLVKLRNEIYLKEFGRNLKKIRQEKGITQTQISFNADIELSQIARIETGKINPTICILKVIAKTLKIPPKDLLDF